MYVYVRFYCFDDVPNSIANKERQNPYSYVEEIHEEFI